MELKEWTYEEYPEYAYEVPGAEWLDTTGDEQGVVYLKDVEYARVEDSVLHLQILVPSSRNRKYNPRSGKPDFRYPCVVYVQGSAWMPQYVYGNLPQLARLAERGYVTAIVEYRHSGIAGFPAQASDARNAIRFLRKHADEFGIDPDRIAVTGDSSGGHTAMWACLLDDDEGIANLYPGVSASVSAIINFYGCVSVIPEDAFPSTVNHLKEDSPEGMVMGGVDLSRRPDLCRRLSVECNIRPDTPLPPVLILHGTKDRTVNTKLSVMLYKHLIKCSKEAYLVLLRGADHGGPEFWTPEALDRIDGFLKKPFTAQSA